MKKTVSKYQIGEGLFTTGSTEVFKDFGPDSSAVFELVAFTQSVKDELEEEHDFKFSELSEEDSPEMKKIGFLILKRLVKGWHEFTSFGQEIPFTDENLKAIAGTLVGIEIVGDCSRLAASVREAEEKNSES